MIRTDLGCETLAKGKIVTPMLGFGNACTDIKKQKQEQFKKKKTKSVLDLYPFSVKKEVISQLIKKNGT